MNPSRQTELWRSPPPGLRYFRYAAAGEVLPEFDPLTPTQAMGQQFISFLPFPLEMELVRWAVGAFGTQVLLP